MLRRIYIFTQHKRLEKHSRTCIDMESSLLTRPPDEGPRARTKNHQPDRAHGFLRPEGHSGKTARTARRKNVHNRHAVAQRNRLLGPVFSGRTKSKPKACCATDRTRTFLETIIPHTQKPLSNARGLTTKKQLIFKFKRSLRVHLPFHGIVQRLRQKKISEKVNNKDHLKHTYAICKGTTPS